MFEFFQLFFEFVFDCFDGVLDDIGVCYVVGGGEDWYGVEFFDDFVCEWVQ